MKDKETEKALEAYREAQTDRPDSPELHYNVGDALYKQGAIDEAMAAFQKAVASGDPTLGSKASYNLGNALYKKQAFDQAVAAYEKALELNSSDHDTKVNLEMALEKLEEEKKQDQEKGDDEKNNEDKENEQEKQDQNEKVQFLQFAYQVQVSKKSWNSQFFLFPDRCCLRHLILP